MMRDQAGSHPPAMLRFRIMQGGKDDPQIFERGRHRSQRGSTIKKKERRTKSYEICGEKKASLGESVLVGPERRRPMDNLTGRCPKTGKEVDLQFETDGESMNRIWSKPLRFHCPHCGKTHETKVGSTFAENVLARALSRHAQAER
jgi:hypothetical protein